MTHCSRSDSTLKLQKITGFEESGKYSGNVTYHVKRHPIKSTHGEFLRVVPYITRNISRSNQRAKELINRHTGAEEAYLEDNQYVVRVVCEPRGGLERDNAIFTTHRGSKFSQVYGDKSNQIMHISYKNLQRQDSKASCIGSLD